MTQNEIFGILKNALITLFEIDEAKITSQILIYEVLCIDSFYVFFFIDYVKKKTGYRLLPEDFKNVKTLEDIAIIVSRKLADN